MNMAILALHPEKPPCLLSRRDKTSVTTGTGSTGGSYVFAFLKNSMIATVS